MVNSRLAFPNFRIEIFGSLRKSSSDLRNTIVRSFHSVQMTFRSLSSVIFSVLVFFVYSEAQVDAHLIFEYLVPPQKLNVVFPHYIFPKIVSIKMVATRIEVSD